MPRTKDQASRNVGGNANKDSNGDKQSRNRAAATPNRRDAYMGAKKSSGAVSKPVTRTLADKVTDNIPRISYAPNMSRVSELAPMSSPRAKSAPAKIRSPQAGKMPSVGLPKVFGGGMTSPVSKVAPTKSPRPPRSPGGSPPATKNTRSKANPRRKQKTYPGRTPYNYAV